MHARHTQQGTSSFLDLSDLDAKAKGKARGKSGPDAEAAKATAAAKAVKAVVARLRGFAEETCVPAVLDFKVAADLLDMDAGAEFGVDGSKHEVG